MLPLASAQFACRVEVNRENLGFVRTMNRAVEEAVACRMDLLLLNSDTIVEPGALREMAAALAIDHMIAFVNPRSNNATITTLPVPARPGQSARNGSAGNGGAGSGGPGGGGAWREAARTLADRLPQISYIPTAVGFCLLVRWNILAEFGGFDEIYGQGYNEENDLVMRAGRCGYRAVMANHAFVWHEGEESFATSTLDRSVWEPANRAILDARYPEYGGHTAAYYHSPEATAENLLAQLVPDADGCLDIGLDFSSFRAAHNGTFQAGRQLLQAAAIWGPHYRLHVICSKEVYDYHGYAQFGVPHSDTHSGRRFAAIFRVGQPYDWNVIQRLAVSAPVIGIWMLDTISLDCPQLASARLFNIWQFAMDHADVIAAQSEQTRAQLAARLRLPGHAIVIVAPHSRDLADYLLPVEPPVHASGEPQIQLPVEPPVHASGEPKIQAQGGPASATGRTILVIGNHFHHKYLSQTANALASAWPQREIVAMGLGRAPDRVQDRPAGRTGSRPGGRAQGRANGEAQGRAEGRAAHDPTQPPPLASLPNLTPLPVGDLSDGQIGAHYAACDVVVFPSHAEGFGFPVLNALAASRPVFLRRLPVFVELWETLGRTANIHFYDTTAELVAALGDPPAWIAEPAFPPASTAHALPVGVTHGSRDMSPDGSAAQSPNGAAMVMRPNGAAMGARRIRTALEAAIEAADYGRIVCRIRAMQLASDLSDSGRPAPPSTQVAEAAQFVALGVERVARHALSVRPIYHGARLMFRTARLGWRAVRRPLL
jgi:GT2 family glycosyltransferase